MIYSVLNIKASIGIALRYVQQIFIPSTILIVSTLAFCLATAEPSSAQNVCFDLHQSNCKESDRFVDLLGNAPAHYKVYFDDPNLYVSDRIFQHYEFLASTFIDDMPSEPMKYDYDREYTDFSNVLIFGQKPLFVKVETWGPYIGCCFSDEYSAYFDAQSFELSASHRAFTQLYFCTTDKMSQPEFAEELARTEYHRTLPFLATPDEVVHIHCGRRLLSHNQDTLPFMFDAQLYDRWTDVKK